MKAFTIVITLFFADPAHQGPDAVELTHKHGKMLMFKNTETCNEHVWKNLETLKEVGLAVYPKAITVKQIFCIEREDK